MIRNYLVNASCSSRRQPPLQIGRKGGAPSQWLLGAALCLLLARALQAQGGTPAPVPEEQPTLMKILAERGEHNLADERWNAYGQFTYISGWKPSFDALYTNLNGSPNSLLPGDRTELYRHRHALPRSQTLARR